MRIKHLAISSVLVVLSACGATAPALAQQPTQLEYACAEMSEVYVDINRAFDQGIGEYTVVNHIITHDALTEDGQRLALALTRVRYDILKDEKLTDLEFAAVSFHLCVEAHTPTY